VESYEKGPGLKYFEKMQGKEQERHGWQGGEGKWQEYSVAKGTKED
jgi:hypothetical protein